MLDPDHPHLVLSRLPRRNPGGDARLCSPLRSFLHALHRRIAAGRGSGSSGPAMDSRRRSGKKPDGRWRRSVPTPFGVPQGVRGVGASHALRSTSGREGVGASHALRSTSGRATQPRDRVLVTGATAMTVSRNGCRGSCPGRSGLYAKRTLSRKAFLACTVLARTSHGSFSPASRRRASRFTRTRNGPPSLGVIKRPWWTASWTNYLPRASARDLPKSASFCGKSVGMKSIPVRTPSTKPQRPGRRRIIEGNILYPWQQAEPA